MTFVPMDRLALNKKYLREEDVDRINAYHSQVYEKIAPHLNEEERKWLAEETRPL